MLALLCRHGDVPRSTCRSAASLSWISKPLKVLASRTRSDLASRNCVRDAHGAGASSRLMGAKSMMSSHMVAWAVSEQGAPSRPTVKCRLHKRTIPDPSSFSNTTQQRSWKRIDRIDSRQISTKVLCQRSSLSLPSLLRRSFQPTQLFTFR